MARRIWILCLSLICLGIAVPAPAQESVEGVLEDLYGRGVHAYFEHRYEDAHGLLTNAITSGLKDPRAFYFRGLTLSRLGRPDEAQAEFATGAEHEATAAEPVNVGKSLERVQGADRLRIEQHRRAARLALHNKQEAAAKARYEERIRAEERVLLPRRRPANGAAPPPAAEADETNPFGTRPAPLPAAPGEARPAAPVKPDTTEPKPVEPAPAEPAEPVPAEPKPAEPKPAEPASDDPFAEPKPTTPKPAEPKPAASDDPFGADAKPAEPKPAEPAEPAPDAEPAPANAEPAAAADSPAASAEPKRGSILGSLFRAVKASIPDAPAAGTTPPAAVKPAGDPNAPDPFGAPADKPASSPAAEAAEEAEQAIKKATEEAARAAKEAAGALREPAATAPADDKDPFAK